MPRPESDFTAEDILCMSLPPGLDGSTSLPGTLERRKKSKGGSEEPEDGTDGSMPSKPLMRGTRWVWPSDDLYQIVPEYLTTPYQFNPLDSPLFPLSLSCNCLCPYCELSLYACNYDTHTHSICIDFSSIDPGAYNSRSPIRKRSASFRRISRIKKKEERGHDSKVRVYIHHDALHIEKSRRGSMFKIVGTWGGGVMLIECKLKNNFHTIFW